MVGDVTPNAGEFMGGEDCKTGCICWLDGRDEEWDAPIEAPIIKPSGWTGEHRKLACFKCETREFVSWGMHPGILVITYDWSVGGDTGAIDSYVLSQSVLSRPIHAARSKAYLVRNPCYLHRYRGWFDCFFIVCHFHGDIREVIKERDFLGFARCFVL